MLDEMNKLYIIYIDMQYENPLIVFFIWCYLNPYDWQLTEFLSFSSSIINFLFLKLNLRIATNFMLFLVWQWCFSIRDKYKNERNISIHYVGYSDYKLVLLGDFDGGTVLKNSYLEKKLCHIQLSQNGWPQFFEKN